MGSYWKILFIVGLQLLAVPGYAEQANINALRYWHTPDQTQLLFDVSSSPEHRVFLMKNPARLVIDMRNTVMPATLEQPQASHPLFSRVRAAVRNHKDLRVVVDLKREINSKNMSLRTNHLNGKRFIIELLDKGPKIERAEQKPKAKKSQKKAAEQVQLAQIAKQAPAVKVEAAAKQEPVSKKATPSKTAMRPTKKIAKNNKAIVVAIDAGHGGKDPGSHGHNGTEEKFVTLAIAKKLAKLIDRQPGMKAVLVRKGDYFVPLRKRMQIARAAKADLFISIHADAFKNETVKGASAFTLSNKGATSEAARWLADSENAADLVGGVSLSDKDDVLASVLLDLSQTATQYASVDVANLVLKNFKRIGELHIGQVQKAGFAVLKSPDVPSILVETAFISNPSEELKLVNTAHQSKIASAIFEGVRGYFNKLAPKRTLPDDASIVAMDM